MKVAIYGLGVSGLSSLKFLATQSDIDCYAVSAGKVEDWDELDVILSSIPRKACYSEDEAQDLLESVDVIVKSPGISLENRALVKAQMSRVPIISEIELAARYCQLPIIAVTGTNGKTTTVTMTAQLLEKMGKRPFLCGNIGLPFIELFLQRTDEFDVVVVEVSSFQLETIEQFHPQVAILTNLTPSHGERYGVHDLYRDAKLRLFKNMTQSDTAILHASLAEGLDLPCAKIASNIQEIESLFDFDQSVLLGVHNQENLFFAWKAVESFLGVSEELNKCVQQLIKEFRPVPFRTEIIYKTDKLWVVNDGKSTNLDSTIAAINCFSDYPLCLILGGKLRDELMQVERLHRLPIKSVYTFGESAQFITQKLAGHFEIYQAQRLEDVLSQLTLDLKNKSSEHQVVLFSPAFPSFDLYENYKERALHFNKLVDKMVKELN